MVAGTEGRNKGKGMSGGRVRVIQAKAEARTSVWLKVQRTSSVSSGAKRQRRGRTRLGWALMQLDFIFAAYFHPFHIRASTARDSVRPQVIFTIFD